MIYNMESEQITIYPVNYKYCIATTKAGKQCKNKPGENHYCCKHTTYKFEKPDNCPICLTSIKKINKPLSCGHWVHKSCILKWKDQCPVCRQKIELSNKDKMILNKNKNKNSNILPNNNILPDNNILIEVIPLDENNFDDVLLIREFLSSFGINPDTIQIEYFDDFT